MVKQLFLGAVVVAALSACGGKKESTMPDEGGGEETESGPINDSDSAATMVPPEKMDEIARLLERKQNIISRCLSGAVERQELPKNSRGKMALDIVISPSGRAEKVSVIKTSLESKSLEECVIGHVREIQFPQLPKTYPTSHTYAFEAM